MIRKAVPADLMAVMSFGEMMLAHSLFPPSLEKAAQEIAATIENGEAYVADIGGDIVGTVGYYIASPWYTEQRAVFDKWMCARETHQGGMLAGKLLLKLESVADELGLPFLPGISGDLVNAKTFDGRYKKVGVMYKRDAR